MKKILLSLFVGFIGVVSFCSALNVSDFVEYIKTETVTVPYGQGVPIYTLNSSSDYGTYCVKITSLDGRQGFFGMTNTINNFNNDWFVTFYDDWSYPLYVCTYSNQQYIEFYGYRFSFTVTYELFKLNTLLNTSIPVMTSLECQTNYSLVPLSELESCQSDYNVCENSLYTALDDLSSCQVDLEDCQSSCMSGGLSGENWSALFINSLQFPGKPIVNVLIPDYITWDYSDDENSFNLSVGSGYDVDYINSVIDINSYRPTSEDFTDVFVSGLTLIMPYIVIVLFIIFTWKLIKRIFK